MKSNLHILISGSYYILIFSYFRKKIRNQLIIITTLADKQNVVFHIPWLFHPFNQFTSTNLYISLVYIFKFTLY